MFDYLNPLFPIISATLISSGSTMQDFSNISIAATKQKEGTYSFSTRKLFSALCDRTNNESLKNFFIELRKKCNSKERLELTPADCEETYDVIN